MLRVISLSGLSMPSFWLGLLILMAFVAWFGTIPIYTDPPVGFWNALALYSVPAAAVGFRSSALVMRLTRSSMLEVLRQDYIRTARAKGASDADVNYHHALRNALLPVVTVIGIEAAFLMGGLIVTETVFNIPGVARFLVEAIRWRDYPIVQNLVMFIAVVAVVDQFPDRPALRGARSAHPVRGVSHGHASTSTLHRPMDIDRTREHLVEARAITPPRIRSASSAPSSCWCSSSPRCSPISSPPTTRSRTNSRDLAAAAGPRPWLGADAMGRDIYSRIVYGARISLAVGIGSTLLGSLVRRRRSGLPPAISAAGSISSSSASSTCCRRCRCWCWRW